MIAAVRGFPMEIRYGLVRLVKASPGLSDVAEAFGFSDIDTYIDALEREGPRIFRRMRW